MTDALAEPNRRPTVVGPLELTHREWLESLDMIGQPAFVHDRDYRIIRANRAYAQCAGTSVDGVIGRTYFDVFPRLGGPQPCCIPDMEVAAPGRVQEHELTLPNGDVLRSHARAVRDPAGRYLYSVHVLEDVTQSRLTADALRVRSQRLAVLNSLLRRSLGDKPLLEQLEGALDDLLSLPWLPLSQKGGIFLVEDDPRTLVLRVNRNLASALQTLCAKVSFGHCLCGRAAEAGHLLHAECVDHRHENRYEGMLPHGHYAVPLVSGSTLLGVIILYVPHGHPRSREEEEFLESVANTLAGIIERKKAQAARRASEARLTTIASHLARLRTAGEMAAELAHELKQPLTAIVTNAQVAQRAIGTGKGGPGLLEEIMGDIEANGLRAAGVIKQLRGFVRKTEPTRRPGDINELVRGIAKLIAVEAGPVGIELRLDLAGGLPEVLAEGVQIEQVILNLARNGIDAMHQVPLSRRKLTIETAAAGGETVVVHVRDTGEGIPRNESAQIFEPFHSTKSDGLGMGLCISRSIVEAHGGQIELDSEVGRGTTFSFTLPVVHEE